MFFIVILITIFKEKEGKRQKNLDFSGYSGIKIIKFPSVRKV